MLCLKICKQAIHKAFFLIYFYHLPTFLLDLSLLVRPDVAGEAVVHVSG